MILLLLKGVFSSHNHLAIAQGEFVEFVAKPSTCLQNRRLNEHTHTHTSTRNNKIRQCYKERIPSILYALLDEYCLLIFRGKTIPWYLSMAMQVIVRIPVTMAVVCTKGTVLQTRTPARKQSEQTTSYQETAGSMHFFYSHVTSCLISGSKQR